MRIGDAGVLEVPGHIGGVDGWLVRPARGLGVADVVLGGHLPFLVEAGLVDVAVSVSLPAGGGEVVGPRVGRVGVVGVDLLPGILRRILAVTAAGEEVLGPVRIGGDPDRLALAHRVGIFVSFIGQRFGDGVDQGEEHGHVAAGAAGDEGAQAVAGLGGSHVPLSSRFRLPLPVRRRIDLQEGGVEDLDEPGPGDQLDLVVQQLVDDPGGEDIEVRRRAGDLAGLPGIHVTGHTRSQRRGWRCRTVRASVIQPFADWVEVRKATARLPVQVSATGGQPSGPNGSSRSTSMPPSGWATSE